MALKLLFSAGLLVFLATNDAIAQDCSVPFVPSEFKTRLAWQSGQDGASMVASPMVANMNPQEDSMPEIMVVEGSNFNIHNKLQIYKGDGSNANNPLILTIPGGFDYYPAPGPTIGDVDGDGIPELLIACADRRIRVFNHFTENPLAPMNLWITSASLLDFVDQRPLLADFDADGIPEVYAGSDIYKFDFSNPAAPTLTKVINGGANQGRAHFDYYSEGSCNPTAVDILTPADCNGDPDCGGLELVAGPIIYSIDLDLSDGDGYEIKVQRDLNTMIVPPTAGYGDGYTSVADLNLDGILDIVVTSRRFSNNFGVYVWNKNGLIRWFAYPVNEWYSGSLACIANVYDDTKLGYATDFPEILVCSSRNLTCYSLHAAQSFPASPYWWNLPTSDVSGWTGSTVYDFNGDGILEIVYRDESNLRIMYGGGAPFPPGVDGQRNWFKSPCFSRTADEYPVVADVDNDGETEIVVTGRLGPSSFTTIGRLNVYESDAGPWVPCRNVWNQFNYFIVNVNDDLSIPAVQQTHHLELPAAGSGIRPFNMYLSQRPVLNDNFEPYIPLPDASASIAQVLCYPDSITVQLNVCNIGDQNLQTGTPVAFYQSDPTTTTALLLGSVQWTNALVKKDSCKVFSFTLPKTSGTVFGVVNDDGSKPRPYQLDVDFPVNNQLECHFLNNIFQFEMPGTSDPVNLGPDYGACKDTVLLLDAGTTYVSYLWQDGSTSHNFQAQQSGLYWVEATDLCAQKHTDSVIVEVFEKPAIQLNTINGDCSGNPAILTASAQSNYPPFNYAWSSGDNVPNVVGLPDGTYTVTVTNAKGCTSIDSVWVEAGGNLQVSASIAAPILCFGQSGAINLNLSVGKPPFTFLWSDGSQTQDLPIAPAGNYAVTVTDADQCADTIQISIAQPTPLLSNGLVATPSCPGLSTGEAGFLGAMQGTPPYTLLWSNSATAPNLSGLASGVYQLTLTDANACTVVENIQVPEFLAPVKELTEADMSCFGANDGSLSVNVLNGSPSFEFLWSNNATTQQISGLQPGNYTLTLTYANGACAETLDFNLAEPLPILLTTLPSSANCNGGLGSSIALTVQNGVAPLGYLWSNNATSKDLINVSSGTYTVTVTDARACTEEISVQLTEPTALVSAGLNTVPACPGEANGSAVFLGASQGTPPYSLLWSTNDTGPVLNGLPVGTYQLTLSDANGCTIVESTQVAEFSAPVTELLEADLSCFGANDGSLSVNVLSGSPGFGFLWSNNATTQQITDLQPGNYGLTLTYANGTCTKTLDFTLEEPLPILLSTTSSPAICNGGLGGSVELTVQNGVAPLAYLWSNNAISKDLANIGAGAYQVTVTDANGCSETFAQAVASLPAITLNASTQSPQCAGGIDGSIQILPGGGTAPFQVLWSNGSSDALLTAVLAGTYTATVSDAAACTEVLSVQLTEPTALVSAGTSAEPACPGEANGSAVFLGASQGTPPYSLLWSTNDTGPNLNGLSAGSYQLTLTDAQGCSLVENLQVSEFTPPAVQTSSSNVSCFGFQNGSISVELSAGSPGFGYAWSNNATTPNIASLAPGVYTLTLTYADGTCAQTFDYQIIEPSELLLSNPSVTPVNCFGENNGAIDISTLGGVAPYQFQWSGNFTTEDLSGLIAGNYQLTLTDENGCTLQQQFTVSQPPELSLVAIIGADTCQSSDGAIEINTLGGIQPYQYAWSNAVSSPNQINLAAGQYQLTLTDDHGCTSQLSVQVPKYGEIPVISPYTDILTCAQTTVNVGVTANQNNLHYNWVAPGGTLSDQAVHAVQTAGTYQVTVINAFGCESDAQIQVLQDVVSPVAEAGPPSLDVPCDGTTALLNASGSSQGSNFQNRWIGVPENGAAFDTLAVLLPIVEGGLYIHSVLNLQNGCMAWDSIWVNWDEPIAAAIVVDSIRCFGDADGKIALQNVSGGAPPLSYSLGNLPFTTQQTYSGLEPGNYLLRIRDDFGCTWERSILLTEPEALTVALTASDTALALGQTVQLNATPMPSGVDLAAIEWEPESFLYTPLSLQQRLKPETHTEFVVRITDQNGCVAEDRLWVSVYNHHIYVPNIILPGSETNSWFTIFAGDGVLEIRSLRVFDRWGEQVYERFGFLPNVPELGWDGAYRGQPMNPGVFVWYAEVLLQDGQVVFLKGDVTVAR